MKSLRILIFLTKNCTAFFSIVIPTVLNFMLFSIKSVNMRVWFVGCKIYGRLSHEGPRPMGGMPSIVLLLKDPIPYLLEFWRKPWKTPNG